MERGGAVGDDLRARDELERDAQRWRRSRPFVALVMAMIAGILLGRLLPWSAGWLGLAGVLTGASLWLACRRRPRGGAAMRWGLLAVVALSAAGYVVRVEHVPADHISRYITGEAQLARVIGVIVDDPRQSERDLGAFAAFDYRPPRTHATLEVRSVVVGEQRETRPASGRLLLHLSASDHRFEQGQRIRATGWLGALHGPANIGEFDYRKAMARQGVVGRLTLNNRDNWQLLAEPSVARPTAALQALRRHVAEALHDSLQLGMADHDRAMTLLEALLLGVRGAELAETYDAFRRVGLAHLMSISGAHLAILLMLVWAIVRLIIPRPRWAAMVVLMVLGLYLLALPPRVPILRASIMAAFFCAGTASGRGVPALAMLAIAAAAVLAWRPADLFDPGFQLSFGVVAALLFWAGPVSQWMWPAAPLEPDVPEAGRLGTLAARRAVDALAVSVVAFCVALPVVAYHFQLISPLAVVVSLLALPVVTVLLGLGYLKMLVGLFAPSGSIVLAGPLAWVSETMLGLVDHAQHWPGAAIELGRSPSGAWAAASVALAAALFAGRFAHRRKALTAAVAIMLLWAVAVERDWASWRDPAPALRLHSFAVGHGSCHLLQLGGRAMLFDCGSHTHPRFGERSVAPALRQLGIDRIDTAFVSHAHLDHFNGLLDLADSVPIGRVMLPPAMWELAHDEPRSAPAVLVRGLRDRGVRVEAVHRGWRQRAGDAQLEMLAPPAGLQASTANDHSLVLAVDVAGRRLLLPGDIEAEATAALLAAEPTLRADITIMPHHGDFSPAAIDLIEAVAPRVLVQSCDWRRMERDRWPDQLAGMGMDDVLRLVTAEHGMIEVAVFADGRIEWSTFDDPQRRPIASVNTSGPRRLTSTRLEE